MNFNQREIRLMVIVLAAALIGLTYFIGRPMWQRYQQQRSNMHNLRMTIATQEEILDEEPALMRQLRTLQANLPQYPAGQTVTSIKLEQLAKIASASKITLGRKRPSEPREYGEMGLYEMQISCDWSGRLEPLTYFLYNLQNQGGALDVRRMTVTPLPNQPGQLKGNFILDAAYTQGTAAPETSAQPADQEEETL